MMHRLLCGSTHLQLFVLALLAGLGEELLFRGLLQAGLARLLPTPFALVGSLLIASVIFGACHYLSHTYFVLATLAGLYFGALMLVSDSIVPPIIAHALYDFFALVYLLSEHGHRPHHHRCEPIQPACEPAMSPATEETAAANESPDPTEPTEA